MSAQTVITAVKRLLIRLQRIWNRLFAIPNILNLLVIGSFKICSSGVQPAAGLAVYLLNAGYAGCTVSDESIGLLST
jgi:hypothetical protein